MATSTAVELEVLHHDSGSKTAPALEGPALASLSTAGPVLSIHDRDAATQSLPKGRSLIVITQLAGINFITSFSNGLVAIGLPAIAADLALAHSLLVWPTAAFALTSGSLLLLAGSVADVVGSRSVNLVGCFFVALWSLLIGFSRSGIELIMFRALQGVASALTFPTSVSIITNAVESGQRRNIGLASLGLAMPLGFSVGLVLGGVLVTGVGWRVGFYIDGAAGFLLFMVGLWTLPAGIKSETQSSVWKRLKSEIDWMGAGVASACLALFSYVLAAISANVDYIKKPVNIALLVVSLVLAPIFVTWMHRQERSGKPTLVPNSLWKKRAFTSVCLMVLLSTAVMNCMELFSSLFFQEVQELSALQAGLRILPNMILGIALNFLTGYFIDKVPALYAIMISSGICAAAPLIMALIDPRWPFVSLLGMIPPRPFLF